MTGLEELLNKLVKARLLAKKEELEAKLANAKSDYEKIKYSLMLETVNEMISSLEKEGGDK